MKKNLYKRNNINTLAIYFLIFSVFLSSKHAFAQANCTITKTHGLGFTTSIKSVKDNGNNSYTIVLDFIPMFLLP